MDIVSESYSTSYYLGTPKSTARRFREPAGCVRELISRTNGDDCKMRSIDLLAKLD